MRPSVVAAIISLSAALSGCAQYLVAAAIACDVAKCLGTGEERFVNNMSHMIGQSIESNRYPPEAIVDIDERTQEYWYGCCTKTCRYAYTVDKRTRRVIGLKYSGECRIAA